MSSARARLGDVPPEAPLTISDAVSRIIMRNYLLHESLRMKIVNFHSLAKKILREVGELTGSKPKLATVVVAIKRLSDDLPEKKTEAVDVLKGAKLSLLGSVTDITIMGKSGSTMKIVEDVLKLSQRFSVTPNVFQLPHSVKVLADEDEAAPIKDELSRNYPLHVREKTAMISIRFSPSAEKIPGIAALITELLYRNGISMLDVFYGYEDLLLIVEEKFGPRAYQILSKEITTSS
jgi:hypothetical protein